jgi:hypothetical protein
MSRRYSLIAYIVCTLLSVCIKRHRGFAPNPIVDTRIACAVAGTRAEHRGARVPARGRSGGTMRGRMRTHRARLSRASRACALPTPACLRHLPVADAHGQCYHHITPIFF